MRRATYVPAVAVGYNKQTGTEYGAIREHPTHPAFYMISTRPYQKGQITHYDIALKENIEILRPELVLPANKHSQFRVGGGKDWGRYKKYGLEKPKAVVDAAQLRQQFDRLVKSRLPKKYIYDYEQFLDELTAIARGETDAQDS